MNDDTSPPAGGTRREFHQALALLAVAPLAGPAAAQEKKPAETSQTVAEHLAAIAREKYGSHLTDEQLKQVFQAIVRDQYSAELLKKLPLQNGDEPSFVFRADLP